MNATWKSGVHNGRSRRERKLLALYGLATDRGCVAKSNSLVSHCDDPIAVHPPAN